MSQIKDTQSAKVGLSGLFGGTPTPTSTPETPTSREALEETLGEETRQALREDIQRRQYLKAGRPPGTTKGGDRKTPDSVRMTFLVSPEKQEKLREIALRKGLFIKEILDRAIDLVIAEEEGV
jgi:hypothetical protein